MLAEAVAAVPRPSSPPPTYARLTDPTLIARHGFQGLAAAAGRRGNRMPSPDPSEAAASDATSAAATSAMTSAVGDSDVSDESGDDGNADGRPSTRHAVDPAAPPCTCTTRCPYSSSAEPSRRRQHWLLLGQLRREARDRRWLSVSHRPTDQEKCCPNYRPL